MGTSGDLPADQSTLGWTPPGNDSDATMSDAQSGPSRPQNMGSQPATGPKQSNEDSLGSKELEEHRTAMHHLLISVSESMKELRDSGLDQSREKTPQGSTSRKILAENTEKLDEFYRWAAALTDHRDLSTFGHASAVVDPARWLQKAFITIKLKKLTNSLGGAVESSESLESDELSKADAAAKRLHRLLKKFIEEGPQEQHQLPKPAPPPQQQAPVVKNQGFQTLKEAMPKIMTGALKNLQILQNWHKQTVESNSFDATALVQDDHRRALESMNSNFQSVHELATGGEKSATEPLGGKGAPPIAKAISADWVKSQKLVEGMKSISDLMVELHEAYRDTDDKFLTKLVGLLSHAHRMFRALDRDGENPAIRLKTMREPPPVDVSRLRKPVAINRNVKAGKSLKQRDANIARKSKGKSGAPTRR